MDVRCEKCGTEYELDETRLKPGGVTVKCTSCGHMFKIRKRAATNLGMPAVPAVTPPPVSTPPPMGPPSSTLPPLVAPPTSERTGRASSGFEAAGVPRAQTSTGAPGSGPAGERSWIVRMANGEQRTCRELSALQQWIVGGLVKRDSMISRSGKTWKQLGDIPELAQFFRVADEAQTTRTRRDSARPTSPQSVARGESARPAPEVKQTLLGLPVVPAAPPRAPTQPPPPPKSLAAHAGPMAPLASPPANDVRPATASAIQKAPPPVPKISAPPAAPTLLASPGRPFDRAGAGTATKESVAPETRSQVSSAPPVIPPRASSGQSGPVGGIPSGERRTGAWASEDVKPMAEDAGGPAFGGSLRKSDEAGFGGSLRSVPTHDAAFTSSMNQPATFNRPSAGSSQQRPAQRFEDLAPGDLLDDDDAVMPRRSSGGGIGKWIAIGSLFLIAGAAAAIYLIVIRPPKSSGASKEPAALAIDAGPALAIDAATAPPVRPADAELVEALDVLAGDTTTAMQLTAKELAEGEQHAGRLALRSRLGTAIAQQLEDQAALVADRKKAEALRKDSKNRVREAMALAQKAIKTGAGTPHEGLAQVAMADVLRMQDKSAREVKKYLDRALELAPGDREARIIGALLALREKQPAEAKATLDAIEAESSMEATGDVRARFRLAMIAFAAGDVPGAQKAAEEVLTLQANHPAAQALMARLRDAVVNTDPMPLEEDIDAGVVASGSGSGSGSGSSKGSGDKGGDKGSGDKGGGSEPSGDYDSLLSKADRLAEVNCSDAMPYYAKALELKPNGVAALTGRGYCYIDSKQFSSAHSSFRAALAVSRRYEPALWGIGEAYQQQGLKEKALEAYENYLEAYPGTGKAIKQIAGLRKSLGLDDGGDSGSGSGGEPEPEPKEPEPKEPEPKEPEPTEPEPTGGGDETPPE